MKVKQIFVLIIVLFFFQKTSIIAQSNQKIKIDSLSLDGTVLLFEKYESTEMDCEKNSGKPIYCKKEDRLFNNNILDLKEAQSYGLSFLETRYELISKAEVKKPIYDDLNTFRYVFQYKPIISKKGSSCLSNPGALLIKYYVYDRLENVVYDLDIKYYMFICDVDLVVIEINKTFKEVVPKK